MLQALHYWGRSSLVILAASLVGPLGCAPSANAPAPADLRQILNEGADIYNSGDRSGCYRLFEGALRAIRAQSGNQPDIVRMIDKGLADADGQPTDGLRAFALREALQKVAAQLDAGSKSGIHADEKLEPPQEDNLGQEP